MSQIDLESFHRLEEFPIFTSCIRSFGRSIIPPLVTPNHVHELRQLRAAAINKEAEILRRKKDHLRQIKDDHALSMLLENVHKSDFQSNVQDSCALWYPSYLDNQEVSVAISKFPTSGIYSSVHTDAIVCSNVVGSNHGYNSNIAKDTFIDGGANMADCVECSHSNINQECSLCLAELYQNFCTKSFPTDLSPEVPCRSFSLLQNNEDSVMEGELNATIDDGECESLPTVICNQKNVQAETDSESNTTCMTQSTDLEKYMELSCDFSSPDNSAIIWDSKATSQQCTLSRSDDASSETIVNTENELTPCASTMAELTDNIEDEFSNAEEVAGVSNNSEVTIGEMKRAHSVDSYMKIIQNCGKSLNVKKSQSEPFNTSKISNSSDISIKTTITSKNNLLIKEDSKESEEAKDMPEKDDCTQEDVEVFSNNDKAAEAETNKTYPFQKKHIRQNSYTLDHPSSALILAHADCTCNFDVKCISPHCSALKDTCQVTSHSAFVKEKVEIASSPPQIKMLSILNSEKTSKDVHSNKEEMSPIVADIFPNVKEDSCEKSDFGNKKMHVSACNIKEDAKLDAEEYLNKSFLENLNLSNQPKHLEYIQHICEELKVNHELRVKTLREEQNRQWLKLEEEFKEQERLLYEKLIIFEPPRGLSSENEGDHVTSSLNCSYDDVMSEDKCVLQNDLPASNSSGSLFDQIPTTDSSSSTLTSTLFISNKYSPSLSPSEISVLPENARALSPSKNCMPSGKNQYPPSEYVKAQQNDFNASVISLKSKEDPVYVSNDCVSEVNGFSQPTSFVPSYYDLPECRSAIAVPIYDKCDKRVTCFCDNNFEPCRCCTSFNGHTEYDMTSSPPYCMLSREPNSASFSHNTSSQSDSVVLRKQSPCSGIHNKSIDSADYSWSKINMTKLLGKSNDCISTIQKDTLTSHENGELINAQQSNKDHRKSLPLSIKQKFPINNSVSLHAKPSKNGACILYDAALNKKITVDPILMKKFSKLPAFVKGFLTRRLLKTEYVQNLIKTFKDTALLIGKMRDDLPAKGDSVSQGDIDFQRQLIVLLMTTYDNFYDTFFTINTRKQMNIIAESRHYKLKQKNINQEQELTLPVTTNDTESAACKQYKLSSATLKVLERKKSFFDFFTDIYSVLNRMHALISRFYIYPKLIKPNLDSKTYNLADLRKQRSRSVLDMRTYTIDDLPSFKGRAQTSMSTKAFSPSPIYKNSIGFKRKTASARSSPGSKGSLYQKWVP